VFVAYGLAFASYWGAFRHLRADDLSFDVIGVSPVGVWIVLYTVLVPSRPRHALLAMLASSFAPAAAFAVSTQAGIGPTLELPRFVGLLLLPYFGCTLGAYWAAKSLYQLGRELRRATEMGSYRLERRIGAGGMGEVWLARHRMLARPAAIKLIRAHSEPKSEDRFATVVERFEREAQVTATLGSHHTVQLYDFGVTDSGTFYYVMELLDGVDLDTLVRRAGPLPAERVIHLLTQVCHSLDDAHERGLVHRDIKPANIFVCRSEPDPDFAKVLDFGLVTLQRQDDREVALTGEQQVVGTPAFLAPEIAEGKEVSGQADLYALGCVAFWMLTGRLVFEKDTALATIMAHAAERPPRPSEATKQTVPRELDDLVVSCLHKDPSRRPPNARALRDALAEIRLESDWTEQRAKAWWQEW